MPSQTKHIPLAGSHRPPMAKFKMVGPVHPEERVEVTVRLRPRTAVGGGSGRIDLGQVAQETPVHDAGGTGRRPRRSAEDVARVEAFAKSHKLAVVETSVPRRSMILSGRAADIGTAFGVKLQEYTHPDGGTFRGRTGPIMIPADLENIMVGVFGLDNRPQARPHFRCRDVAAGARASGGDLAQFTPPQISQLYDFPTNVDGSGQCIGIIELGGGFSTADLETYFSSLKLPMPNVSSVSVDHGKNQPTGDPGGPDGEVMLDIEVASAVAPKAKIVVYFCPNTDQGFLDAITKAIHDTVNKPSVISISWGGPEVNWTDQAMQQFDQAFQAAAAMGITICVASGDNGSSDGVDDGAPHVDFPASSPMCWPAAGRR